jgi:hypothetical protein
MRDDLLLTLGSIPGYIDFTDDNLLNSLGIDNAGFLRQTYDILTFKPFYDVNNKKQLGFVNLFYYINNHIILDTYYLNGNTAGKTGNTSPVIIYIFKPYKNTYNVYYGITEDYKWYKLTINFENYTIDYVLIAATIPDTDVGFRYITNTLGTQDVESTFHIVGTDGNLYTTGFFNESLKNTLFLEIVSTGNMKSIFKIPTTQEYLIITNDGALCYIYDLFYSDYKENLKKVSDGIITSNKKFRFRRSNSISTSYIDIGINFDIDTNFVGYEYITLYEPPRLDRDENLEGNYILVIGTDHIGNYRVYLE